ncbi:hypothetical protein [Priestia megaterium]|uniref:hypothetical protein n=1 Tax=Priestia megaterium TaxID=1404 RepID=UPI00203E09B5|nr:hypothetical protein [Priestia megaterium]MCM3306969.1 hypothetical protein [Priestia megaterium]
MNNTIVDDLIQKEIFTNVKLQLITIANKVLDNSNNYSNNDLAIDLLNLVNKVEADDEAVNVIIDKLKKSK